ncbi:Myb-binding protein 1A-like protein [Trichinella pseudospiralis]|uniref:Myb-binding protein 1A-like protein n=1 Tax=Trichinella pseudospiralis TaxID=6337 RepID=A0A0V1ETP5_TRIPS|nr:Myb-binding protein 1A-like protein [Trichinella pseudospiralis]
MPQYVETFVIKNVVLKQRTFFILANCNWISVYVPKIDATCVLVVKKINHFEARYVEQLFCSFESCIATCFQHQCLCNSIKYTFFAKQCDLYNINGTYDSIPEDAETGQARHFLLHSCHKEISNVPVANIIQSTSLNVDIITANVHLPSTHRVCRVQKRPFAESYKIQRLQLLTTSSLKRCLAACDAPSNSLCNSVLFSIQEKTCILLSRRHAFVSLGGSSATEDSEAQLFIILHCRNDFKELQFNATQSVRRQSAIAYTASNLHLQILIHHELFYASKAAIRLQLWDSSDDTECLKICLTSNRTDYCDAYYFSSREQTCLTMRLKKQYALPEQHGHQIITKFYDDETLNITLKDANEPYLNNDQHYLTLSSCIKDRETERTNNGQPEFCFLPQLNEMCLLEFYQPLCLSGARLIKSLFFIFHLFFTLESSPMHSYVYIPLFDKVCLIEKYIPQEYPTASRIPVFIYNSLESCIAACSNYMTRELLCNAFMYSDITKACHLHFYTVNIKKGMRPVETGQSQFYLLHRCFNRNNSLLNSAVNKKNETNDKIVFLPALHKLCLIRRRLVSESWFAKPILHTTTPNLKKCLSLCVVNGAAGCNSVIFSLQEKSCTLVTHQSIFSTLSATLKSSAYFFEIDHCKTETLHYPLLTSLLLANATNPIQHFLSFGVRHLPITKSENAIIIDLLNCSTIQYCFYRCVMQRRDFGCNAVFFNAEEKTCLLMKLDVSSMETTDLVLYNFFKGYTRKEKLILSNYEDPLRFKTSFVSLHEFHERCQILTFTSAYAENLKVHSLLLQTNSLHSCLKVCRSNTNDTSCSGVLFSKHEKVCYKVVEGTFYDQIVTEDDQTIVLLQLCVKDREEERRENSMFYHYHLYELEEMCVFESYANHYFSGFAVYDNIPKSSSGYHCILKCASEQISKGCAAVHKSQERCMFFRRNSTARIFRKLENSYFLEMLYCESKFAGNAFDFDAGRLSDVKFDNETVELADQLSVPIWNNKPESECNILLLENMRPLKCLVVAKFINKKFKNFNGIACDFKLNVNIEKHVSFCDLSWRESLKTYALRLPDKKRPWNENLFLYVPMLTNITDSIEHRKHPFGRTGVAGQGILNKLGRNLHYFLYENTMSDYPFNEEMANAVKQGFHNHSNPSIRKRANELFSEAKRSTNTISKTTTITDSDTDDAWLEEVVAEIIHDQHVHLGNINFIPEMNSLSLEWRRVTEQIDEYIMELKRKTGEHYPEPYLTISASKENVLQHFRNLVSLNRDIRVQAETHLVAEVINISNADEKRGIIQYCLKRLIGGLSSARKAARLGFAVVLSKLISAVPEIEIANVLQLMKTGLPLHSTSEGRANALGILMGILAIVHGVKAIQEKEIIFLQFAVENLLQIRSQFLQFEALCMQAFSMILQKSTLKSFKTEIWPRIKCTVVDDFDDENSFCIWLRLSVNERFPEFAAKHLPAASEVYFSDECYSKMLNAMRKYAALHDVLHPFSATVLQTAMKSTKFQSFWTTVVNDGLLNDMEDKKSVVCGLQLIMHFLDANPQPEMIFFVFTVNLLQLVWKISDVGLERNKILAQISVAILKKLFKAVETCNSDWQTELLKRVAVVYFESGIKSRNWRHLVPLFSKYSEMAILSCFKFMEKLTMKSKSEQLIDNQRKMLLFVKLFFQINESSFEIGHHVLAYLLSAVRNCELQAEVLQENASCLRLQTSAVFFSLLNQRFFKSTVKRQPTIAKEHCVVFLNLLKFVNDEWIQKSCAKSGNSDLYQSILNEAKLTTVLLLRSVVEPLEYCDMLEDVLICYNRCNGIVEKDENEPDDSWLSVLTDLFLELLSKPKRDFWNVVLFAFTSFVPVLGMDQIDYIFQVISSDESSILNWMNEEDENLEISCDNHAGTTSEDLDDAEEQDWINGVEKSDDDENDFDINVSDMDEEEEEMADELLQKLLSKRKEAKLEQFQRTLRLKVLRMRCFDLLHAYVVYGQDVVVLVHMVVKLFDFIIMASINFRRQRYLLNSARGILFTLKKWKKFKSIPQEPEVVDAILHALEHVQLYLSETEGKALVIDVQLVLKFLFKIGDKLDETTIKERYESGIASVLGKAVDLYCKVPFGRIDVLLSVALHKRTNLLFDFLPNVVQNAFNKDIHEAARAKCLALCRNSLTKKAVELFSKKEHLITWPKFCQTLKEQFGMWHDEIYSTFAQDENKSTMKKNIFSPVYFAELIALFLKIVKLKGLVELSMFADEVSVQLRSLNISEMPHKILADIHRRFRLEVTKNIMMNSKQLIINNQLFKKLHIFLAEIFFISANNTENKIKTFTVTQRSININTYCHNREKMITFCKTFLMIFSIVLVIDALLYSGYVEEENLSCLFESAKFSGTIEQFTNEAHTRISYARCIRLCLIASFDKKCNVVFHYHKTQTCLLMNISKSDLHSDGDMFLDIVFIHACHEGKMDFLLDAESADMDERILNSSIHLSSSEQHSKKYYFQKTSKEVFSDAELLRTVKFPNVESCVIACDYASQLNNCNAVTYMKRTNTCSYYYFSSLPPLYPAAEENGTAFYILYLSVRDEIEVQTLEIPSNKSLPYLLRISNLMPSEFQNVDEYYDTKMEPFASDTASEEVFAVNLYNYYEVCIIKVLKDFNSTGLAVKHVFTNVRSLNYCLHLCRNMLPQWPYRAVQYSRAVHKCAIIELNTEGTTRRLPSRKRLIELQQCTSDRYELRNENPAPLKFYLKEEKEVCVIEFFANSSVGGWKLLKKSYTSTIVGCIAECRLFNRSQNCRAFNYTPEKECLIFAGGEEEYTVIPNSWFGEIMNCEKGLLTDIVSKF